MIWVSRDTEKKSFGLITKNGLLAGIKQEADLKHLFQTQREITVDSGFIVSLYLSSSSPHPPLPPQKKSHTADQHVKKQSCPS